MKKNKKGMTLTEVIVAMTIFGIMSAAIITALAFSVKYTQRSKKRDTELAQQATAVGKHTDTELTQIGSNKFTINFNDLTHPSLSKTADVNLFSTNDKQFGADFGFNLKTFQQGNLTSLPVTLTPSATDEFQFEIKNNSTEVITVVVNLKDGYIFEGSNDTNSGYIHTSTYYSRTIKAGAAAEFGYCNAAPTSNSLELIINNQDGVTLPSINVDVSSMSPGSKRTLTVT